MVIGAGIGISFGVMDGAAVSSVESSRAGMAAGMFNTMRLAGEAIATPKREVAMAKTYFAVKAREAELAQAAEPDVASPGGVLVLAEKYLAAAQDLVKTKKELAVAKPKANKWDTATPTT